MSTIMHNLPLSTPVAQRVGEAVKGARRDLGLNQDELSLVAGVSRRTVHAVEHGKPTVRLDALVAILRAVGLDLVVTPHRARSETT
jgi:HTH-type transcriptional regulator / antitoxin HipB